MVTAVVTGAFSAGSFIFALYIRNVFASGHYLVCILFHVAAMSKVQFSGAPVHV